MLEFTQYAPTEIVFGKGAQLRTGEEVKKWGGNRVLIVFGGGSVIKSGLLQTVEESLDQEGIRYERFGGVQPNPRLSFAEEGVKKAVEINADFILAVGGGSAIDTAKAIAHGAANPECALWDIWMKKVKTKNPLPVGSVLTIAAAGSETSDSAVLTNEELGVKAGLGTDLNRPRFAIMNPELTYTLPKYQLACGIVDIMMHTLERYFIPNQKNRMTDEIAEGLLRVVVESAKAAMKDQTDYDAMSEIMWCGSLSHNWLTGLGGAKGLSVHPVSFALSEKYDIIHGEALSALWCSWARYVCKVNEDNYKFFARYARNVWDIAEPDVKKAANAGIDASEAYFKSLGMPVSIGELSCGVQDEAGIEDLAARVSYHGTRRVGTLVSLDHEALREIYAMANH